MDIAMRTSPYINLVVHVIEMWRAAKRRGQLRRPLVAVNGSRRISVLRRVFQFDIRIGWIVPGYVCLAIRHHSIASVGVIRINRALQAVFSDRKAPARRLRHPGQHDHGHQWIASGCFHVLDVFHGVGVTDLGVAEIFEIPIGRGIVGESLPVVSGGRVAAPTNHGEPAVRNRWRILGIASPINIRANRMPITEYVDSDVDRGCGMIGRGRTPGRIALGGSCRSSSCMRSGTTPRRAIRKEQCEYCNASTRDSVTHGEGLRVSEYSTACQTASVTRKFTLRNCSAGTKNVSGWTRGSAPRIHRRVSG